MHPFKKFILNYSDLNENEWNQIESCLSKNFYKKGDIILRNGKICKKLYFLEKGYLRYFILKDGKEISKYFTEAPYCFTSQRSFANNIPAEDNIEVLKDATIWEINRTDAFDLLKIFNWAEFVRKLIQEVQFLTEQILEQTQNMTAEERYIKMIEENDAILNNVPLKDIASFLGIAPQSLSRIRKKYWADKTA